jgi:hypothetical protein
MSFLKGAFLYCFLCIASVFPLFASQEDNLPEENLPYYNYCKLSLGVESSVSMDLGHRYKRGHHGIDGGIGITSLVYATEGHVFVNYLFYPVLSPSSQFYLGVGLQAGIAHSKYIEEMGRHLSPQIILGKEFSSSSGAKKFIQVSADMDAFKRIKKFEYSSLTIAAGFGF